MKLMKFTWVIVLAILLASCETKKIKLYPTIQESKVFDIVNSGGSDEEECINVDEIQDHINDLNQDGDITAVYIEGVWLEIKKDAITGSPATTATTTTVNLVLKGWDGSDYVLVQNMVVDVTKSKQTIYLHPYLKKQAILKLKEMFFKVATLNNGDKYELCFELNSDNQPANSLLNTRVEVFVKIAVEYSQEVEMI